MNDYRDSGVSVIDMSDNSIKFKLFKMVRMRKDAPRYYVVEQTGEFLVVGFQIRVGEKVCLVRSHYKGDQFGNLVWAFPEKVLELVV